MDLGVKLLKALLFGPPTCAPYLQVDNILAKSEKIRGYLEEILYVKKMAWLYVTRSIVEYIQ